MFKTIVLFALVAVAASAAIDSCGNVLDAGCGGSLGLIQSSGLVSGCSSGNGRIVSNNCKCEKVIQRFRPVQQVINQPTERRTIQTGTRDVVQQIPYQVNVGPNVGPSTYGSSVLPNIGYGSSILSSNIGYGAPILSSGLDCGASVLSSGLNYGAPVLSSGLGCGASVISSGLGCGSSIVSSGLNYGAPIVSSGVSCGAPIVSSGLSCGAPIVSSGLNYGAPILSSCGNTLPIDVVGNCGSIC